MQTSGGNMMGGAPHHISSNTPGVIAPSVGADGLLKFDEIVLESNEIDLAELQATVGFTERRFPQAIYLGIMVDGKRHGRGVMKYANGR